jgi:hypothetical protein
MTSVLEGGGWSAPRRGCFTPGKDPRLIVQEAGWAPGPVWTGAKNLAPIEIQSPDHTASCYTDWAIPVPRTVFYGFNLWGVLHLFLVLWLFCKFSAAVFLLLPVDLICSQGCSLKVKCFCDTQWQRIAWSTGYTRLGAFYLKAEAQLSCETCFLFNISDDGQFCHQVINEANRMHTWSVRRLTILYLIITYMFWPFLGHLEEENTYKRCM